uniref:Uncharacterized protein n=1 Tax=Romanomermis culicivorax TaxID=13658 RepID=A0A915KW42_ROMCU
MEAKVENTVEYWIYPFKNTNSDDILAFILSNSSSYIWHNEAFKLMQRDLPVIHFYGSSNYGDNADDEWFIVHLLLQLSVKFSDLVIRVQDEDGDFMLIEAADFLPRWMHSSTASMLNRTHFNSSHAILQKFIILNKFFEHISTVSTTTFRFALLELVSIIDSKICCNDTNPQFEEKLFAFGLKIRVDNNLVLASKHRAPMNVPNERSLDSLCLKQCLSSPDHRGYFVKQ